MLRLTERPRGPLTVIVATVLATVALAPTLFAQAPVSSTPHQIVITAQGDVELPPDRARVTLGVETEGKTAQEAAQANAALQARILAAVQKVGIPAASIRTSGYNVAPKQEYIPETRTWRVDGYRVTNLVVVLVEPVGKAGEVIDAALDAGANRVAGLSFEIKDATAARETAIERAVERARREAAIAAKAAGGTVAGLLELSVNSYESMPPRPMMDAMAMRAEVAPTPISEGTQAVTVSVTTRWEFVRGPR
jgi:uncharacterized protein YggE